MNMNMNMRERERERGRRMNNIKGILLQTCYSKIFHNYNQHFVQALKYF